MSNQGDLHQWVRDQTGTTLDYNGDWHALFDQSAIPAGDLNGRMLSWLNAQLGVTYDNLPGAQNAYAISCGVDNWNSLSQGVPVPPAGFVFLVDVDGIYLTDADGAYLLEAA